MKNKAVILGANYYIGLSAMRCLGTNGIHVVAIDYSEEGTYGFKSKYCSEKLIAPHYKKNPKEYIEFLKDYAKKQTEKPVLLPCADQYVEIIDKHLDEMKEYYLIPQKEQGLYTQVMNKETLHSLAEEHGVLVPETVRPGEENFYEKINETVKFPCIVKPVDSPSFVAKFRKKLFKVQNMDELNDALQKSKQSDLEVIVQRIIPGSDDHMYTFDVYLNQDAKVTHYLTCQKHRQYPINFGASVYTEQKYVPELYDIGAKFLEDIEYRGFAEIEFKKDSETGKFYLIEINVRFSNLNTLVAKAGLNMPLITYKELIGEPLKSTNNIKYDTKLMFWYAYEDLLAAKDYIKTGQLTSKEVFKSLFRQKAHAIWDIKDPKPFFSFCGKIGGRVAKKVLPNKR